MLLSCLNYTTSLLGGSREDDCHGRIDMVVETTRFVYVLELKVIKELERYQENY